LEKKKKKNLFKLSYVLLFVTYHLEMLLLEYISWFNVLEFCCLEGCVAGPALRIGDIGESLERHFWSGGKFLQNKKSWPKIGYFQKMLFLFRFNFMPPLSP